MAVRSKGVKNWLKVNAIMGESFQRTVSAVFLACDKALQEKKKARPSGFQGAVLMHGTLHQHLGLVEKNTELGMTETRFSDVARLGKDS